MARKITLAVSILLVSLICAVAYLKSQDRAEQTMITWGETEPSNQSPTTELRTEQNGIWHLNLAITGETNEDGQLSIGENDSTIYKVYKIKKGKIKIEYDGDWYANKCFVNFKSTLPTKGRLDVHAEFVGD